MGFSGQEYWSGLPFPSPGELPIHMIQFIILITNNRRIPQGGLWFYQKANESKKWWWSVFCSGYWVEPGWGSHQELAWFEISTSAKGRKAMGFFFFFFKSDCIESGKGKREEGIESCQTSNIKNTVYYNYDCVLHNSMCLCNYIKQLKSF